MTDFTTDRTEVMIDPVTGEIIDQKELEHTLLAQANEQGMSLVGPGKGPVHFSSRRSGVTGIRQSCSCGSFLMEYDVETRRVIRTTKVSESINARCRRAVRTRGHFPNEAAALKFLYLVTRFLDPSCGGRAR